MTTPAPYVPPTMTAYDQPVKPDGEVRTGQPLDADFFTKLLAAVAGSGPRLTRLAVDNTKVPRDGQIARYDASSAGTSGLAITLGTQPAGSLVGVNKFDAVSANGVLVYGAAGDASPVATLRLQDETGLFVSLGAGAWFLAARGLHLVSLRDWLQAFFDARYDTRYAPAGGVGSSAASADVQVFTASGTWTKPTGAKSVHAVVIGAGGGGGGGARTPSGTAVSGGAGGTCGAHAMMTWPAAALRATEAVAVGAGGPAGAAASADSTTGAAGGTGGTSSFAGSSGAAVTLPAYGGGGGAGGLAGTSSGGGDWNAGFSMFPMRGGAAGTSGAAGTAGPTNYLSGSGGSGGGLAASPAALAGGVGGGAIQSMGVAGTGGLASGTAAGGAGTGGTAGYPGPGAGGGGGGSRTAAAAGAGGTGGSYGGAGGGGGSALNGQAAGAGGAGAPGIVVVTTYF